MDCTGAVFYCTHADNPLEIRVLGRLFNRVPILRRFASSNRPPLSLREYLCDTGRLLTPCRLYGSLFCSFCGTAEVCPREFRYIIPYRLRLYLDSTRMGAELDVHRISVGERRLFAMEQSDRDTSRFCYQCTRHQLCDCPFQRRHCNPALQTARVATRDPNRRTPPDFNDLLFQLRRLTISER